jgi:hypothetical protein
MNLPEIFLYIAFRELNLERFEDAYRDYGHA